MSKDKLIEVQAKQIEEQREQIEQLQKHHEQLQMQILSQQNTSMDMYQIVKKMSQLQREMFHKIVEIQKLKNVFEDLPN